MMRVSSIRILEHGFFHFFGGCKKETMWELEKKKLLAKTQGGKHS